jgi:hypothetical protein
MGWLANLLLSLLVLGALIGVMVAGAVLIGILTTIFMVGFLFYCTLEWFRGK